MADKPEFFYYADGRKVPLELVPDTIAVAFTGPISDRRLAELEAGDTTLSRLGRSPAMLSRNILIYRVGPAGRGPDRLESFAERLRQSGDVRYVTNTFRDPDSGLYLILTDEFVVRFRPEATPAQRDRLHAEMGAEVVEQNVYVPRQFLMRVPDATTQRLLDVTNAYHQHELVEWAAPNFLREKRLAFQGRQWHLNNTAANNNGGVAGEDVDAFAAWTITQGDPNIVIAVFDTGVDMDHPDLAANIAPGGRNFEQGEDPDNPHPDPTDTNPNAAHGTACAGVIAGRGGRIDGIAPQCRILPIKMMQALDNDLATAFHYAAERAHVLSNSWNSGSNPPVEAAIRDVLATGRSGKGAVVLFAAGNGNLPMFPGPQSTEGVIKVGASNNVGARSGYSNFGLLSVLAPSDGTSADPGLWQAHLSSPSIGGSARGPFQDDGSTTRIFTTDIRGDEGYNRETTGAVDPVNIPTNALDYTGRFGGTSSATPLAAGICALMLSLNDELTRQQVQYILEATADKIGTRTARQDSPPSQPQPGFEANYDPNGFDQFTHTDGQRYSRYGFGRVNARRAVQAVQTNVIQQFFGNTYRDEITVTLRRVPGTNKFVSEQELELVDARRDQEQPQPTGRLRVFGAPAGFLRATFQPPGGAPAISDELNVSGQPG